MPITVPPQAKINFVPSPGAKSFQNFGVKLSKNSKAFNATTLESIEAGIQKVGTVGTVGTGKQQNPRGRMKKREKMKKNPCIYT